MIDSFKSFLNEEQDPKAVEKIYGKLRDLLMSGEEIQYIAVQKKPAVNISPDCVALTNKRIIFCRAKNLGLSTDFKDYAWNNVLGSGFKENLLGSDFFVKTTSNEQEIIDFLPKAQARKLYQFSQEREEEQRELRRQKDLEDKKAAAASATTLTSPQPFVQQEPSKLDDTTSALEKLKMLFEKGLITQQEYNDKKAEVLSRI